MNKLFCFLFLCLFFLNVCGSVMDGQNHNFEDETIFSSAKNFNVINGYGSSIVYIDRIGIDFYSAKDSLMKKIILPDSGCPENPCQEFYLTLETMSIDFEFDNRIFTVLVFNEPVNMIPINTPCEVLDSRGNHFRIQWQID